MMKRLRFLKRMMPIMVLALLSIKSNAGEIYLIGSPCGWIAPDASNKDALSEWMLPETKSGSNIYENVFEMPEGSVMFRFYKALTGWDGGDSYGICREDIPQLADLNNGFYSGGIMKGKGAWHVSNCPGGKMLITVDFNRNTVTLNTSDTTPSVMEIGGIMYYKTSATEVEVTSKSGGYYGDIVIPDTVDYDGNKMAVTAIAKDAFNDCDNLLSISIPATITGKFYTWLSDCNSLTAINVNENHETYSSIDGVVFNKDKTALLCCPIGKSGNYTIPDGVTVIGNKYDGGFLGMVYEQAFTGCAKLTSVTIPVSVVDMSPMQEFKECSSMMKFNVDEGNVAYSTLDGVLTTKDKSTILYYPAGKIGKYSIPDVVTKINSTAFYGSKLTSLTIHKNVVEIGNYAFWGCQNLEEINYNAVNCDVGQRYGVGGGAYIYCQNIKEINIGNDVNRLHHGIFSDLGMVTTIDIPDNVVSLDGGTFYGENIEVIKIGAGVTARICGAFESKNLRSIEVSANNPAYMSHDGILFTKDMSTLIQYPSAKEGNTYKVPESVSAIEEVAFCGCSLLETIGLPNAITAIPYRAFYGCSSLKKVNIPNGVSLIDADAFMLCEALRTLTISETVDSIANNAFADCYNLTEIVSLNRVAPKCGSDYSFGYGYYPAFSDIKLYIPSGSRESYGNAKCWKNFTIIEGAAATLSVTKNIGNAGSLSIPSSVVVGESVTLVAVSDNGYEFGAWTQNGVVLSRDSEYTFVMPLACDIVAEFVPISNDNNVEVTTSQPNEATITFESEENASGYVVNIYSDTEMTNLVASKEYDSKGNIIPFSTGISLTFDGLDAGDYYYELIVLSENSNEGESVVASKYIGSFSVSSSGVEKVTSETIVYCIPQMGGIRIINAGHMKYSLFDLSGRVIDKGSINSNDEFLSVGSYGVYLLKIGQDKFKVVIR